MPRATNLSLVVMIVLAAAALGIPAFLYPDRSGDDVSDEALHRLKTQDALGYKIRPLFTDAKMTGPTPDHAVGTVVWRTLFGIDVGGRHDVDATRWAGTWVAFLLAGLTLGAFVLRGSLGNRNQPPQNTTTAGPDSMCCINNSAWVSYVL